jgi:hypothetical protein
MFVAKNSATSWTIVDMEPGSVITATGSASFECGMPASSVTCVYMAGGYTALEVEGGAGGGTIDLRMSGLASQVFGNDGADTIIGSDELVGDILDGGDGIDIVDGRLGNDTISGGLGADRSYGGGGDDTINSVDGVADTTNTCDQSYTPGGDAGPGANDWAHIDLVGIGDTAAPDCENVERHADSGGSIADTDGYISTYIFAHQVEADRRVVFDPAPNPLASTVTVKEHAPNSDIWEITYTQALDAYVAPHAPECAYAPDDNVDTSTHTVLCDVGATLFDRGMELWLGNG